MTRTAADATILLEAISNNRRRRREQNRVPKSYRIGVVREPFWNASDLVIGKSLQSLESALRKLQSRPEINVIDPVSGDQAAYDAVSGDSGMIIC